MLNFIKTNMSKVKIVARILNVERSGLYESNKH